MVTDVYTPIITLFQKIFIAIYNYIIATTITGKSFLVIRSAIEGVTNIKTKVASTQCMSTNIIS